MPEHTGVERPGGRTARTRRAVHDAVRELVGESGELTVADVSARSGVHTTTIYRRWRTLESLLLDVAVEDLNVRAPVPITGELERDLTAYVRQLLTSIRTTSEMTFLRVLLSAARQANSVAEVSAVVEPRVAQFQGMLDAAGVARIDGMRLVEIIIAPAYFWGQLGAPLDPDADAQRLVETALLACRG